MQCGRTHRTTKDEPPESQADAALQRHGQEELLAKKEAKERTHNGLSELLSHSHLEGIREIDTAEVRLLPEIAFVNHVTMQQVVRERRDDQRAAVWIHLPWNAKITLGRGG